MSQKVSYITFMKHAKKVAKGPAIKSRPVLGGVIHREGYIAVTDSHRLYYATDLHEGKEKNINPVTGEEIDEGAYPEVERIIPESRTEVQSIKISDVSKLYDYVRAIEVVSRINKTTDIMAMEFDDGYFSIRTDDEITDGIVKYVEGSKEPKDEETIYVNIKYVKEALMLFRDAKISGIVINQYGINNPITIAGGNLTTLIMPVRKKGSEL